MVRVNSKALADYVERERRRIEFERERFEIQERLAALQWERVLGRQVRARPPSCAEWLVTLACSPGRIDEIAGDLEERYRRIAGRDGERAAAHWYWAQALKLLIWQLIRFAFWAVESVSKIAQVFLRLGG